MSEDKHRVLHIYEGDSAYVVRENGNKSLYGVQLPELLALFNGALSIGDADKQADGLVERLREVDHYDTRYLLCDEAADALEDAAGWRERVAGDYGKALEKLAAVERERDALKHGEPNAKKALDALALRWAVRSWMTKDFPQQACEDFKHDVLATYVSLAQPYLNRAEAAEAKVLALEPLLRESRDRIDYVADTAFEHDLVSRIDAALEQAHPNEKQGSIGELRWPT